MNKTQFKPGQSGNPAGKPKGARSPSVIQQARDLIDSGAVDAVAVCRAIIRRDFGYLQSVGITAKKVTAKNMLDASEMIISKGAV